ncbi:MAG: hypothetical protein AAB804_03365 [Patescibacteria group bacterium]
MHEYEPHSRKVAEMPVRRIYRHPAAGTRRRLWNNTGDVAGNPTVRTSNLRPNSNVPGEDLTIRRSEVKDAFESHDDPKQP